MSSSVKEQELLHWLALHSVDQIGPVAFVKLVEHFGSAQNVFKASHQNLAQIPGLSKSVIQNIVSFNSYDTIQKEWDLYQEKEIHIITYQCPHYPVLLKQISSFPPLLFALGLLDVLKQKKWVGVVGSRSLTDYGSMSCQSLVKELVSSGVGIVSGFARGIDIQAHLTALESGGVTIGVLAGGLGHIYPPGHKRHLNRFLKRGILLTEFSYFTEPTPPLFPRRNRIISGLSQATVVVEAREKSGALITAQYALDQNRDVYAVPGPISSSQSAGCHRLIQQGAQLVSSADDILRDMNLSPIRHTISFESPEEEAIYTACRSQGLTPDDIVNHTGYPSSMVTMLLTKLELSGRVKVVSGRRYMSL